MNHCKGISTICVCSPSTLSPHREAAPGRIDLLDPSPQAQLHPWSGSHTSVTDVQSDGRKQDQLDCNLCYCFLKGFLRVGMIRFGVKVNKLWTINKDQTSPTFQRFCNVSSVPAGKKFLNVHTLPPAGSVLPRRATVHDRPSSGQDSA